MLNVHRGVIETQTVATWKDATDGWVPVGGEVRVPRGTVNARVQISVTSLRGSFHVDDCTFVRRWE
jgi:hypothetical protein